MIAMKMMKLKIIYSNNGKLSTTNSTAKRNVIVLSFKATYPENHYKMQIIT